VEKQLTKELFVIKMINIGQEGSEERKKAQKEIAAEINIGMTSGSIFRDLLLQEYLLPHNGIL
jgi:hypothetical protein